ncbi:hypothetical protein PPTG_21641 [Phytophthora nicotianae INRA-310]|uniref:Uncharacterized protein n=1 Tax=Phytophthora nicotianae (strain INRA-310) TaxID=761204 RepID=W2QVU8_PHYN3|nr:hypothetical protein PPTG_21641 [Phytophthora nicotianae INRA-310]ETN17332.1 hypothetical protein PPTG_21641 [Phytophthora nicotianae INRA-310]
MDLRDDVQLHESDHRSSTYGRAYDNRKTWRTTHLEQFSDGTALVNKEMLPAHNNSTDTTTWAAITLFLKSKWVRVNRTVVSRIKDCSRTIFTAIYWKTIRG